MKDELCHHGIDGQRWGVQHGPPYPLSRSEHRAVIKQAKKEAKSRRAAEKRNVTYKKSGRLARQMTDDDLNTAIDRLRREEMYRQMVSKNKKPNIVATKIKEHVEEKKNQNKIQKQLGIQKPEGVVKRAVKESVGSGIKTMSAAAFKQLVNTIWPIEETPNIKWTKTQNGYNIQGDAKSISELDKIYKMVMDVGAEKATTQTKQSSTPKVNVNMPISSIVPENIPVFSYNVPSNDDILNKKMSTIDPVRAEQALNNFMLKNYSGW